MTWVIPISRRGRCRAKVVVALAVTSMLASCMPSDINVTIFRDVTAESGLSGYVGMTHGAAWGDFDGDGLPDVYVTNHLNDLQLFRNLGSGRFADVTGQYFAPADRKGDKHGAAWGDFDNDGRLDLVQLTGAGRGVGKEPKRLWHNVGGRFVDVGASTGMMNPEGRTRSPLWVDLNADGKLDLFEGAEGRLDAKTPPFVFMQGATGFEPDARALAIASRSAPYCVLSATGSDKPELICRLEGQGTALQVFDLSSLPAKTLDLLPQTGAEDMAIGDFDNDGRLDVFMARKNAAGAVAFGHPATDQLIASVLIDSRNVDQPTGFSFHTKGKVHVQVAAAYPHDAVTPERIHLGASDARPDAFTFDLDPAVGGMISPVPGAQSGVYIGFSAPDKWEARVTAAREHLVTRDAKSQDVQLAISSSEPIAKVEAVGKTEDEAAPFRLFMNHDGKLVEESEKRGVNKRLVAGANVVAGDFNNDMYLDLFVLASGEIGRQENLLLLNDGTGHFQVVKAAGGASGRLNGVGDSVTTVDFDGDGWLDLFVANGGSMGRSLGLPSDGGGYRLYRNLGEFGKGNHWIEIDLQGTQSNRDGIGAMVHLTAGGVTQTRLQNGGMHHRSQNHSRLHFGLAQNSKVDRIVVRWPGGTVQELRDAKPDQVIRIIEPARGRTGGADLDK